MRTLLIIFILFSLVSFGQSSDSATGKKIDLKMDMEKHQAWSRTGIQLMGGGLSAGIVGSAVRASNITLTGAGLFIIGTVILFDSRKFTGKDSRVSFTGNKVTYSIR